MLSCHSSIYYNYADRTDAYIKTKKAIYATVTLCYTILTALPTFIYLVSWKEILRLFILVDTILVVTLAATLAFINLMLIFDTDDGWEYSIIQAGFAI